VATRLVVLLLGALVLLRAAGTEQGTLPVLLVGTLPLVLLLAWPVLLVAGLRRDRRLGLAAVALVAVHLLVLAPAVVASPAPPPDAPRLRVAVANLYVLNPDPRRTGEALRALALDVLVVPELTAAGLAGLRASGLTEDLPYALVPGEAAQETVGLFSRHPLSAVALRSGAGRLLPRATVQVGGRQVRVLAAHTLPPVTVLQRDWRRGLRDLAAEVRETRLPVVVVGDLNADRDHGAFRPLLGTGLVDAADERGRGLQGTWPARVPLLHLDHVLVRGGTGAGVVPADVRTVRLPGTDHRAVVADLALLPG